MSKQSDLIFHNAKHIVTSPFGDRISPITGKPEFHNGVDYGTYKQKLPQYPLEKGIIKSVGTDKSGANLVYVEYQRLGYIGLHYHLDSVSVKKGQEVDENTILGYTGKTGQATGIHLHYGWFKSKDWSKPFNSREWEDFEKYTIPEIQPEPTPEPTPTSKYKVGDQVKIIGTGNGSADGKSNTAYGIGYIKTIKKQYLDRPFPNQVGDANGTIGFYADSALEPYKTSETINLGDTVIVNGQGTSSSDGTGNKTKPYTNHKMKVISIIKTAKQPYALSQDNTGNIGDFKKVSGWFNITNIKKQ